MNNSDFYKKLIFIISLPRSGGHVLLSSLSDHRQIMVWPFEFFYFNFFNENQHDNKAYGETLNRILIETIESEIYKSCSSYLESNNISIEEYYDTLDFNLKMFITELTKENKKIFDSAGYLQFIFQCLHKSQPSYADKKISYYLMFTGVRGFDWSNKLIIGNSKLIFMHRPLEDWYASIRKKQVDNNDGYNIINPFNKKSFMYWMETAYRMRMAISDIKYKENLLNIYLYDFQRAPELCIDILCSKLKLRKETILCKMTFLGVSFLGHSHNHSLNQGKILQLVNNYNDGMTDFELEIVKRFSKYHNSSRKSIYSIPFIVHTVYNSNKIRSNISTGNFLVKDIGTIYYIFLDSVYKFFTLMSLRYKMVSKIVLIRSNKHIKYFPIWNKTT